MYRFHQLADRDLDRANGLLDVMEILVEEVPPDPSCGDSELKVGQMADETINGIPCRRARFRYWHARDFTEYR